jgi:hypothetical protein
MTVTAQVDRFDCRIPSDPIGKTIGFNRIRLGSFALGVTSTDVLTKDVLTKQVIEKQNRILI